MRFHPTSQWVAAAMCALACCGSGSAAEAKLKLSGLKAPQFVLSPADMRSGGGPPGMPGAGASIDRSAGAVRSGHSITFRKDDTTPFNIRIAGNDVGIICKGEKLFAKVGEREGAMRMSGREVAPLPLKFEDGTQYALAFPTWSPSRTGGGFLTYRSAGEMVGRLGRSEIAIYDADCNGVYSALSDAYRSGDSLVYAPIGSFITNGKEVFSVAEIANDGSQVTATEVEDKLGELTVDPGRGVQIFTVIQGSPELAFTTDGRTGTYTVVQGTYSLAYGVALAGRSIVALIEKGRLPEVTVGSEDVTMEMGGPYQLAFRTMKSGSSVSISPGYIQLLGKNGEEYTNFEFEGNPTVAVVDGNKPKTLGSFSYG